MGGCNFSGRGLCKRADVVPWHLIRRDQERQEKEEGDGESLAPPPFLGSPPAGGRGGVTRAVLGLLGS